MRCARKTATPSNASAVRAARHNIQEIWGIPAKLPSPAASQTSPVPRAITPRHIQNDNCSVIKIPPPKITPKNALDTVSCKNAVAIPSAKSGSVHAKGNHRHARSRTAISINKQSVAVRTAADPPMKKPEATVAPIMPAQSPIATDVCNRRTDVMLITSRRHARTVKIIGPKKTATITAQTDASVSKISDVIVSTYNIHRQNIVLHQAAAERQPPLRHLCAQQRTAPC